MRYMISYGATPVRGRWATFEVRKMMKEEGKRQKESISMESIFLPGRPLDAVQDLYHETARGAQL